MVMNITFIKSTSSWLGSELGGRSWLGLRSGLGSDKGQRWCFGLVWTLLIPVSCADRQQLACSVLLY